MVKSESPEWAFVVPREPSQSRPLNDWDKHTSQHKFRDGICWAINHRYDFQSREIWLPYRLRTGPLTLWRRKRAWSLPVSHTTRHGKFPTLKRRL
ncbi:hypothetical protein Cob_v008332 [Colletotrichum orbiculare MAFF 240422]|uniref:Uncharacterized protein n=1 Tax=Colletotrichum orbiculare (strain 104-T / ATCC 96160 / CBS 514.97 / LARS 414 / MAFF 240422) TaxID=1213857 RepID=A0A484FJZ5_COLOR|nr:hypothetical protein Cob_v008332 [Colletotrichum orbiculare MAFF 240422]